MNEQPTPEMGAMAFREVMLQHAMGWGNGVAEIVANRSGSRIELWPIDPQLLTIKRSENDNRLLYEVRSNRGGTVTLAPEQVFHLHGLGYDGVSGYSFARVARESIGLGLAQIKSAASLFGNSSRPDGILQFPQVLTDKARDAVRQGWEANYRGPEKAHKTAILDRGLTFTPVGVNPIDAQWIEASQFTVEEFCRVSRCPPSKVQHLLKANFNTLEMQNLEYVVDTLMSWMIRIEQETKRKLIGFADKNVYAKHNANSILRGDIEARYRAYAIGRQWGWENPNSVLELEDRDGIGEQGDIYLVPGNMLDASKINEPKPEPMVPGTTVGTTAGDEEITAGVRAAISDRVHEEVTRATSIKEGISNLVYAHAPTMKVVFDRVEKTSRKRKEVADGTYPVVTEWIDSVASACVDSAWSVFITVDRPPTLDRAVSAWSTSSASRVIESIGTMDRDELVTIELGRLCTFVEGIICAEA
jgi:HK97 family phage portal protein